LVLCPFRILIASIHVELSNVTSTDIMAERRATNKYYPPDWDPSKGSINKYKQSHPLRERARKLDRGILIIRFGMPFNIWCLGCNNHVGRGVRYNAEKSKIGNYYDTPIYRFDMKCHLCDNRIIINTDPSRLDYAVESGARRQVMPSKEEDDDQTLVDPNALAKGKTSQRRLNDSMYRLEKEIEGKIENDSSRVNLRDIKKWRSRFEDSFSANQMVRAQYRKKRKSLEQAKDRDKRLLKRASLRIPLIQPSPSDRSKARDFLIKTSEERLCRKESSSKMNILATGKFISEPRQIIRPSCSKIGESSKDPT